MPMKKKVLNDEEMDLVLGGCREYCQESPVSDILNLISDLRNFAEEQRNTAAEQDFFPAANDLSAVCGGTRHLYH